MRCRLSPTADVPSRKKWSVSSRPSRKVKGAFGNDRTMVAASQTLLAKDIFWSAPSKSAAKTLPPLPLSAIEICLR